MCEKPPRQRDLTASPLRFALASRMSWATLDRAIWMVNETKTPVLRTVIPVLSIEHLREAAEIGPTP
jgi:hypothetical protein